MKLGSGGSTIAVRAGRCNSNEETVVGSQLERIDRELNQRDFRDWGLGFYAQSRDDRRGVVVLCVC